MTKCSYIGEYSSFLIRTILEATQIIMKYQIEEEEIT